MALLTLFAAFALAPQQYERLPEAPAELARTGAVMTIDGLPVSGDEYGLWLLDMQGSRQARHFAERHLVEKAARAKGVALAPGAVDAKIDAEVESRVKGAFSGEREEWLDELARTGWSELGNREYRRVELEPRLLAEEMTRRERKVPEQLVVRDWELSYGPQGKEITLSGLRIDVAVESPDEASADQRDIDRRRAFAKALARALEVRERAVAGEDFAALARECSDDAETRASGGRIQAQFRPPGWGEAFVEGVLALPVGSLSMPMYTQGGYWIVRVEQVVETPLEQVRDELEKRLVEQGPEDFEVAETISRISAGAQVELLPQLFESGGSVERKLGEPGLRINGEPVAREEFARWLARSRGEHYVRDFAEHVLVERRARALGLAVDETEIGARMDEFQQHMISQSYKGSREAWLAYMRSTGRDEAGWRREWHRRMRIEVLCEKILKAERVVTDDDVRERWRGDYGAQGRWIEARLILVPLTLPSLNPGQSREELERQIVVARTTTLAQAQAVRQRLVAGEDFGALARALSGDVESAPRGGQLDGRFRPDQWPEAVVEVVARLAPGELSPVLETERGFALFEVTSSRLVPFEEVAGELRRELENERPAQGDLAGLRNLLVQKARIVTTPGVYGK